jgi:thiamine biosynthesis lipoprotein ApbE
MPKPCQCNRWGTGTCAPSQSKETQSKEMNVKLQQMLAERDRQDSMWSIPSDQNSKVEKVQQTNENVLSKS